MEQVIDLQVASIRVYFISVKLTCRDIEFESLNLLNKQLFKSAAF